MGSLELEFEYYLSNLPELVKKYNKKFVVVSGKEVKYAGDNFEDSLDWAMNHLTPGEFIIQECSPEKESYTQTFHTRAIFA